MKPWPKPDTPGPGQESVWDHPRPPRLEGFTGSITVELGGHTIASTTQPSPDFAPITGAIAVMAAAVDRCTVNGEEVIPQPGGLYGGWITSWIVGPFKGIPDPRVGDTPAADGLWCAPPVSRGSLRSRRCQR